MAVAPKPPAKHLRDDDDADEEEEEEELVESSHWISDRVVVFMIFWCSS